MCIAQAGEHEVRIAQLRHDVLDDLEFRGVGRELTVDEAIGERLLVVLGARLEEHQILRQV